MNANIAESLTSLFTATACIYCQHGDHKVDVSVLPMALSCQLYTTIQFLWTVLIPQYSFSEPSYRQNSSPGHLPLDSCFVPTDVDPHVSRLYYEFICLLLVKFCSNVLAVCSWKAWIEGTVEAWRWYSWSQTEENCVWTAGIAEHNTCYQYIKQTTAIASAVSLAKQYWFHFDLFLFFLV